MGVCTLAKLVKEERKRRREVNKKQTEKDKNRERKMKEREREISRPAYFPHKKSKSDLKVHARKAERETEREK
jgi:hypothetical protein